MSCGCGSRAERLLKRLGYQETTLLDGKSRALTYGDVIIPVTDLNERHFVLTLYGIWKFLTTEEVDNAAA